jgi:hypothetical protein
MQVEGYRPAQHISERLVALCTERDFWLWNALTAKKSMQSPRTNPDSGWGTSGGWHLLLGHWADAPEEVIHLDVYLFAKCKRVEFFDLDLSLHPPV